jgi:hypothetical protein
MPPEVIVRLEGTPPESRKEQLTLSINGAPARMNFRVGALSRRLVGQVGDIIHDLLDIAATVYAADCSTSRGGLTGRAVGRDWCRQFHLQVPVRSLDVWVRDDIDQLLQETLGFLSDDNWRFSFRHRDAGGPTQGVFDFGPDSEVRARRVVMFSGGLDSFAGDLEELIDRNERMVLVSHGSATKLAKVQRDLIAEMRKRTGDQSLMHVVLTAQLANQARKEGTQRSRSFLFAALGIAVAEMIGVDDVSFYENGVVSLNLPLLGQVVGARATRTTHPKVLSDFSRLFGSSPSAPAGYEPLPAAHEGRCCRHPRPSGIRRPDSTHPQLRRRSQSDHPAQALWSLFSMHRSSLCHPQSGP